MAWPGKISSGYQIRIPPPSPPPPQKPLSHPLRRFLFFFGEPIQICRANVTVNRSAATGARCLPSVDGEALAAEGEGGANDDEEHAWEYTWAWVARPCPKPDVSDRAQASLFSPKPGPKARND